MEDFDNAKTRNPKECVVTNLNSYLTYISDIKETIKKEEAQRSVPARSSVAETVAFAVFQHDHGAGAT